MERFEVNPFVSELKIQKQSKIVKVSGALGEHNNVVVNQKTGEIVGAYTHVTTYKKVDPDEYVKIFTKNIALTFELSSAGLKALNVLIWAVQYHSIGKDLVQLDSLTLKKFLENTPQKCKLSLATLTRGLSDLVKSKIIAPYTSRGWYFTNPNFIFNGDRIAFTTAIEKETIKTIQNNT